jgi:hypothetical protein
MTTWNIPPNLQKIASKENAREASVIAIELFFSDKPKPEKKVDLSNFLQTNIENLDDSVELLPGWGVILKGLIDSPLVDNIERAACDALAEIIVQATRDTAHANGAPQ